MRAAFTLALGLLSACSGHRYAVSDSAAAQRHQRSWLIVHEPPPEPPRPAAPAVVEAGPALPAAAPPDTPAPPGEASSSDTAPTTPSPETAPEAPSTADGSAPPAEEPPAQPTPADEPAAPAPPPRYEQVDLTRDITDEPDLSASDPPPPKLRRMVWGLSMRLGGTFGADDLITAEYTDGSTQTLTTGGGVNFFLGTTVTPFKVGSHVLTFGFEGGWKSSSIGENSDTDITFSRHAFMPRVQYGYELTPAILWIVGAGAQYETGIELKVSGAYYGRTEVDNALGYFGETGFWLDVGLFGMDLTLRHTQMTYRSPGLPSLDADSFGLLGTVHIGLLKTENTAASRRR